MIASARHSCTEQESIAGAANGSSCTILDGRRFKNMSDKAVFDHARILVRQTVALTQPFMGPHKAHALPKLCVELKPKADSGHAHVPLLLTDHRHALSASALHLTLRERRRLWYPRGGGLRLHFLQV